MSDSQSKPNSQSIPAVYEASAEFWAKQRATGAFPEETYMRWVEESIPKGSEVLDLGCGSGFPIANFFLQKGFGVVGIDVANAMIEKAKAQFPAENFPRAAWFVGDMKAVSLNRKFRAIIAWDSFFHLDFKQQENMFPIFRKHLEVGGVLVFTSGTERGESIGDMNGHALFHASLAESEYCQLLQANGFEVDHYDPRTADCGGHTIWRCRLTLKTSR